MVIPARFFFPLVKSFEVREPLLIWISRGGKIYLYSESHLLLAYIKDMDEESFVSLCQLALAFTGKLTPSLALNLLLQDSGIYSGIY